MLERFLHGDDIFISYSRGDGGAYASALAAKLTEKKFSCFIDKLGTEPNEELPDSLKRKIRGCTLMVLVGTQRAAASTFVGQEIKEFRKTKRTIVPVDFGGAVGKAVWYDTIPGLAAEPEENQEAMKSGKPSPNVISRIENSFNYTRRNTRLGRMAAVATALLLLLLAAGVAAGAYASSQLKEAQRQKDEANLQKGLASLSTASAALERANAEQQRSFAEQAKADAQEQQKIAREKTEEAEKQSKEAKRQSKIAQTQKKEAEKQKKEAERQKEEAAKQKQEADRQKQEAEKQKQEADRQTEIANKETERARVEGAKADAQTTAANARSRLDSDPEQSVLLAVSAEERLRAAGVERPPQLDETLRLALASSHARALLKWGEQPWRYRGPRILRNTLRYDQTYDIASSSDGKLIVTSSKSGTRVWDAQSGDLKATVKRGFERLAFSHDGNFVYMRERTGYLNYVYVWEWRKPEVMAEQRGLLDAGPRPPGENPRLLTDPATQNKLWTVASFGAGGRVLTKSGEVVSVRDLRDGKVLISLPPHGKVQDMGFSPDGEFFYTFAKDTASKSGVVYLWSVSGQSIGSVTLGEKEGTFRLGPGKKLLTKVGSTTVGVWDLGRGVKISTLAVNAGSITSVNFSRDGRRVVTAGSDKTARVWDVETGKTEPIVELSGHHGDVSSAVFSDDGRLVLTASTDGTARVWDAETGLTLLELLGHVGPLSAAKFLPPDDGRIATLSDDGSARVWDAEVARRPVIEFDYAETISDEVASPSWVSFGHGGKTVSVSRGTGRVRHWETATGRELDESGPEGTTVALSDDERLMIMRTRGSAMKVIESATGQEVSTLPANIGYGARFDDRGERVVAWGEKQAGVWDVKTGAQLHNIEAETGSKNSPLRLQTAAFSPGGQLLALAMYGRVELLDTRTWQNVRNITSGDSKATASVLAFSRDGTKVAAAYKERVEVWSVAGEMLKALTPDDGRRVNDVAFSHDGSLMAAADDAGFTQIWSMKDWRSVNVLPEGFKPSYRLAFAPDDGTLMTANGDGRVRLYPREMFLPYKELLDLVPSRVARKELTEAERKRFLPWAREQ
jgi:WD40 repeat protein/outer membrane biosynthesis protein TonB